MKNFLCLTALALALLTPTSVFAQKTNKNLTIKTKIDKTYVFAFDLTESRSAKGGIWNLKKGKFVTPQNYTEAKTDTIDGQPVVMLYRQVMLGNHPLNGWEKWTKKGRQWICMDEAIPDNERKEQKK